MKNVLMIEINQSKPTHTCLVFFAHFFCLIISDCRKEAQIHNTTVFFLLCGALAAVTIADSTKRLFLNISKTVQVREIPQHTYM